MPRWNWGHSEVFLVEEQDGIPFQSFGLQGVPGPPCHLPLKEKVHAAYPLGTLRYPIWLSWRGRQRGVTAETKAKLSGESSLALVGVMTTCAGWGLGKQHLKQPWKWVPRVCRTKKKALSPPSPRQGGQH